MYPLNLEDGLVLVFTYSYSALQAFSIPWLRLMYKVFWDGQPTVATGPNCKTSRLGGGHWCLYIKSNVLYIVWYHYLDSLTLCGRQKALIQHVIYVNCSASTRPSHVLHMPPDWLVKIVCAADACHVAVILIYLRHVYLEGKFSWWENYEILVLCVWVHAPVCCLVCTNHTKTRVHALITNY